MTEALPTPVLHSISARDGWLLRVWDFRPPLDREVRGVVVVGHALEQHDMVVMPVTDNGGAGQHMDVFCLGQSDGLGGDPVQL